LFDYITAIFKIQYIIIIDTIVLVGTRGQAPCPENFYLGKGAMFVSLQKGLKFHD